MLGKLFAVLILASAVLYAQNTSTQNPSPGTTPSGTTSPHQHHMQQSQSGGMQAMHAQMMQQMKQNLQKMKTLLQEMKTNAAGLTGKEKAAMDANVQLWQMMIDHMDQMMNQMSSMHGGMMGGGMSGEMDHSKMHGSESAPTAPPKQ